MRERSNSKTLLWTNATADGAEPRLAVAILGTAPAGSEAGGGSEYDRGEVQALANPGFDGALQLPPEVILRLGHPYEGTTDYIAVIGEVSGWGSG